MALWNQVHSLIGMHQVVCAGPFLYAHVREVSFDVISKSLHAAMCEGSFFYPPV